MSSPMCFTVVLQMKMGCILSFVLILLSLIKHRNASIIEKAYWRYYDQKNYSEILEAIGDKPLIFRDSFVSEWTALGTA